MLNHRVIHLSAMSDKPEKEAVPPEEKRKGKNGSKGKSKESTEKPAGAEKKSSGRGKRGGHK